MERIIIDMDEVSHREAVMNELQKALAPDRTRMTINGFTQLGLVEMTRKRTRDSLAHQLCEPCPTCQGRGNVRTDRSVCYEILREIFWLYVLLKHGGRFLGRQGGGLWELVIIWMNYYLSQTVGVPFPTAPSHHP